MSTTGAPLGHLEREVYGMAQAARLLGLRTDGLRRWIDGYERGGRFYPPVIREERTRADTVTWGEFVEAGYLREYRAKEVPLQYMRPVIAMLRRVLGVRYPLATLRPYTSGKRLALEVPQSLALDPALNIVILSRNGELQLAGEAQAFLEKVDFAGGDDARRLFPVGRAVPVVIDPDVGFGEPTVPRGVRTEVLAELVSAGEDAARVAEVYGIREDEVRAAVDFETRPAA